MSSDILFVCDVYPAREKAIDGVTGELIYNETKSLGHKNVFYINNLENLNDELNKIVQKNDMVITIGAGTIWRYGQAYYENLLNQVEKV